jgi:hypothetical protein
VERIGDESLTRIDSGFVHGKIFRFARQHLLDDDSLCQRPLQRGGEKPQGVNLSMDHVGLLQAVMVNLLLPWGFSKQSVNGKR